MIIMINWDLFSASFCLFPQPVEVGFPTVPG